MGHHDNVQVQEVLRKLSPKCGAPLSEMAISQYLCKLAWSRQVYDDITVLIINFTGSHSNTAIKAASVAEQQLQQQQQVQAQHGRPFSPQPHFPLSGSASDSDASSRVSTDTANAQQQGVSSAVPAYVQAPARTSEDSAGAQAQGSVPGGSPLQHVTSCPPSASADSPSAPLLEETQARGSCSHDACGGCRYCGSRRGTWRWVRRAAAIAAGGALVAGSVWLVARACRSHSASLHGSAQARDDPHGSLRRFWCGG